MSQPDTHDIIIVGGGIVGAALTCLAAAHGLRIALLEAHGPAALDRDEALDLRVSAVSRAAQNILTACGAWPEIRGVRISPYREMRVWDADSRPFAHDALHFDSAELGEPELGHIIENRVTRAALLNVLQTHSNVDLFQPARPVSIELEDECVRVTLQDDRRLAGRLVVGADGSRSATRRLAGLPTAGSDYGQQAVVAHVHTRLPHGETAWQRFLPGGPLALLPLADGRSSVVWSAPDLRARELLSMDEADFCAALGAGSDYVLGAIASAGPRAAFPLQARHAPAYVRHRCALIGDAAHVLHPLAGQGVNLGLLDAAALAEEIGKAIAAGDDPGDLGTLRRYERWRKGHNLAMLIALDGLQRLFRSRAAPLRGLRRLGLAAVNRAGPVKREFARRAMGLSGDLPRYARRDLGVTTVSLRPPAPQRSAKDERSIGRP
ncbi:FAD-dependent 2-octaprenylphenol hydroxylase [soil metagenome]